MPPNANANAPMQVFTLKPIEAVLFEEVISTLRLCPGVHATRPRSAEHDCNNLAHWLNLDLDTQTLATVLSGVASQEQSITMELEFKAGPRLQQFCEAEHMIGDHRSLPSRDAYVMKLLHGDSLYLSYQTIVGSRALGRLSESQKAQLVGRAQQLYEEDFALAEHPSLNPTP